MPFDSYGWPWSKKQIGQSAHPILFTLLEVCPLCFETSFTSHSLSNGPKRASIRGVQRRTTRLRVHQCDTRFWAVC
eukprot:jgi/Botrbrau1/19910/Bobra.0059s0027.1